MILEFNVGKNILKRRENPKVIDQNANYYKCKFYMNKEIWQNSFLFATFMNDLGYIESVQLGEYNELLSCLVPSRLIQGGYFSLYISDDNNRKTNTISITLTNHYKKAQPKCNIISEIFEHIDTKIDDLVYENQQIKCYSNGNLVDVIYIGNADEEAVRNWVNDEIDILRNTLANVAFTGSYNDLVDVPESFPPSQHNHNSSDIENMDEMSGTIADDLLSALKDEIDLI